MTVDADQSHRHPRASDPNHTPRRFTEDEIRTAKANIPTAFAIAGLSDGNSLMCPIHRKVHAGKTLVVDAARGTWRCHSAGEHGDAVDLVMIERGIDFVDAVNLLLGRPVRTAAARQIPTPQDVPDIPVGRRVTSVVDPEVYHALITYSGRPGVEAAAAYYRQWHIGAQAVRDSGATQITEPAAMRRALTDRFGIERLRACGLVTIDRHDADFWLCNDNYPVIEPHHTATGTVVGMQFRPAGRTLALVRAHQAAKKAGRDGVPYQPKFLSLAGIDPSVSLLGCGLARLARLPESTTIRLVEGFKDSLAERTMGWESYAVPGANAPIPEQALQVLRRHRVLVAMDGDDDGRAAQTRTVDHLTKHGVRARAAAMPDDMDSADILVARHASAGCSCRACRTWRAGSQATT